MTNDRPFSRIFIANRGEIAVRVIRACQKLGVESVIGVSAADRDSLGARMATRAVCIGPPSATASYLNADAIVAAAKGTGCEAIHPGYGFLSERATFVRLCEQEGLTFIGPSAEAIDLMGDKVTAVRLAAEAGVPRVPGSDGHVSSAEEARHIGREIGYPILIKASAGGGGRGMRVVNEEVATESAMRLAIAEAEAAFGDGRVYIEKYVARARHIEIQVLGDVHGNIIHLGERDCSAQRRHQKLIEEAPSPAIRPELRERLGEAALSLAHRVGYRGAGTVEFIFDDDTQEFYFLEMNTRIQVEHPVTEMVTGRDLVELQILIAAGEKLPFGQSDVQLQGHAIECRINAEDVARGFAPSPGRITTWLPPTGQGIRLDTHCGEGGMVSPYYDSLLGKLIVHGVDRAAAIETMRNALDAFRIEGVHSTLPLHQKALASEAFQSGKINTRWVEEALLRDE